MSGISIVSDTNPLIYVLNGSEKAAEYLNNKQIWISVISELELFRKRGLTKSEKQEIEFLIESCFVADLNSEIKILTKELLQIANIKLSDAIIAATAIYLDLPLLTFDTDFSRIPNLKLFILEK